MKIYKVNNSVTFHKKPIIRYKKFLNQIFEILDINIDRCFKEMPNKKVDK